MVKLSGTPSCPVASTCPTTTELVLLSWSLHSLSFDGPRSTSTRRAIHQLVVAVRARALARRGVKGRGLQKVVEQKLVVGRPVGEEKDPEAI